MKLTIQSQTEKLSYVREFISQAASKFGFDEESVHKIALAVDEACTNIIKHSYNYVPNKEIHIQIVTDDGNFEVIITHQGKLFDPQAIKPPDMRDYMIHYRKGGLGMHLMRSLMDKVEYRILPDHKSEVHLLKRKPATLNS
jgi:serine/threonine-protein kinase RsbW